MLFKQFIFLAVTALATISFAKPLPKGHADVVARAAAAPQVAKRGVLGLPIELPTPAPNTIPAILLNLDTKLGGLMTGDLNGTIPSGDGDAVGLTTDIETIKKLIDNAQNLLSDATASLSGATGGASSPLETIGALTNVVKTVVALLTNISSASKGLTARQLPTDGLPIVGGLLETLLQTVTNLLGSILGGLGGIGGIGGGLGGIGGGLGGIGGLGANGRKANSDITKALADSVATAASLFSGLGVDATSLTKAVGA